MSPSSRSRTSDLRMSLSENVNYSPPLYQLSYRRDSRALGPARGDSIRKNQSAFAWGLHWACAMEGAGRRPSLAALCFTRAHKDRPALAPWTPSDSQLGEKLPTCVLKRRHPPLPLHPSRDCCPFSLLLFLKALLSGVASLSGSVHVPWAPPRVRGSGAGRPDSCVENLINAQLTVLGGGA